MTVSTDSTLGPVRVDPQGATLLTRHVTGPCLSDTGKADHIDSYRSLRWRGLKAFLTSSSCQGRRGSPGRRRGTRPVRAKRNPAADSAL